MFSIETPEGLPTTRHWAPADFVCMVDRFAYMVSYDKDDDCCKLDHHFYDTLANEWRDDLVPYGNSAYRTLSDEELIKAVQGA